MPAEVPDSRPPAAAAAPSKPRRRPRRWLIGSTDFNAFHTEPVRLGVTGASLVVVNHKACAIDSDGYLYCWGSNAFGALGTGEPESVVHAEPELISG
ncbi:MAG TPA: RCC1 domain-containing protein [Micromonosporaceae bacterium]|nr:RCC1 domain-containing protein [Micromonosporaceae bacterium]